MFDERRVLRPIAFVALLLTLLFGLTFVLAWGDLPSAPADFACFYLGAKALFQGQNAYSLDLLVAMAPGEGYDGWVYQYLYPPHFSFLLLPFIFFPLKVSAAIWTITSALLLVTVVLLLAKGSEKEKLPIKLFAVSSLLMVFSAPTVWSIGLGQNSIAFLFFGAVVMWSLNSRRYILAGAVLALATTKPQIMLVFVILVLMTMAYRKLWNALLSFGVTMFLLGSVVAIIRADLFTTWVDTVVQRQTAGKTVLSSLVLFRQYLGDSSGTIAYLLWTVIVVSILIYLVVRLREAKEDTMSLLLGIGAPATLLISPYFEPYDCTILLLAILPATKSALRNRGAGNIILITVLWLGMILFPAFLWAIPREEMTGIAGVVMILSPLAVYAAALAVLITNYPNRTLPVAAT